MKEKTRIAIIAANIQDSGEEPVLSTIEGVDIDLTSLSSMVVYAQVYKTGVNYRMFKTCS